MVIMWTKYSQYPYSSSLSSVEATIIGHLEECKAFYLFSLILLMTSSTIHCSHSSQGRLYRINHNFTNLLKILEWLCIVLGIKSNYLIMAYKLWYEQIIVYLSNTIEFFSHFYWASACSSHNKSWSQAPKDCFSGNQAWNVLQLDPFYTLGSQLKSLSQRGFS